MIAVGSNRLYSEDPALGHLIAWLQQASLAEVEGAAVYFYAVRRNADEGALVRQYVRDFAPVRGLLPVEGLAAAEGTEDRVYEWLARLATSEMQLSDGQKRGLRTAWEILSPAHARAWLSGEALASARADYMARRQSGR